jgi:hypothetical protein
LDSCAAGFPENKSISFAAVNLLTKISGKSIVRRVDETRANKKLSLDALQLSCCRGGAQSTWQLARR